jgi:putative transcriptional regulator
VVLLAAHGNEGALGWVINGRELMTISDLLVRAEIADGRLPVPGIVRVGGPVLQEQVWLVYRTDQRFSGIPEQLEVGSGITASSSRKVLEAIAGGVHLKSLIGLVGHAAWAASQLEDEIRTGSWLPTDVEPGIVFDVPAEECWQRAYERLGTTPIAFTSRTVGSA